MDIFRCVVRDYGFSKLTVKMVKEELDRQFRRKSTVSLQELADVEQKMIAIAVDHCYGSVSAVGTLQLL